MKRLFSYLLIYTGIIVQQVFAQLQPAASPTPAAVAPPVATAAQSSASVPGLLNGYVPDNSYKLRVGDTVSFQILENRILEIPITPGTPVAPTSLVVADSGELDVPYIGRVMAVDKTCEQLGKEIKAALEKDYYKQATVVLSLNLANRLWGRVYIWGQVRTQGALDIQVNENLTAGKAILRAGGFADFANKKKVRIVRASPDPKGETQSFNLDMTEILEGGKIDKDIVLQPNDLIIVPSRLINF
jgi:protein involved in polysaccharide export with SLBB domain